MKIKMAKINKPKRKTRKHLTENEKIRKEVYNTSKWRKLREAKLMQDPLCEMCLQNEIITAGVDIHHIVSFVQVSDPLRRKELAFDFNNLMTLCKVCHQKLHNS